VRNVIARERLQERDQIVALGWRQDDRARVSSTAAVHFQVDGLGRPSE
jgi:hypothetical protein